MTLRSKVIHLAHSKPELREHLLPLLGKTAGDFAVRARIPGKGWKPEKTFSTEEAMIKWMNALQAKEGDDIEFRTSYPEDHTPSEKTAYRNRFTPTRSSFLPKDGNPTLKQIEGTPPGLEIWTWEDLHPRTHTMLPMAVAFAGKSDKPLFYSWYTSPGALDQQVAKTIASWESHLALKQKRLQEKRDFKHGFAVGDILVSSWGYDQTNVNYFQIVGTPSPKEILLREINKKTVSSNGPADYVMPIKGSYDGPVLRKRPTGDYVRINSVQSAHKWDGKPEYETGFGYGH